MADEALVDGARNGDKEAFKQLVELHYAFVYNLIQRILDNREDAEDQTQEAFLQAWTQISAFRGQKIQVASCTRPTHGR
jgi:RNA polymerase sigma-70 factor (ECF subfamily)